MIRQTLFWMTLACLLGIHAPLWGQTDVFWDFDGTGTWSEETNWTDDLVPIADFDEIAVVDNGGTVLVQDAPAPVGGVVLGQSFGGSGTLHASNGENLTITVNTAFPPSLVDGDLVVGEDGFGTLLISAGGSVTAESVTSGGAAESLIHLSGPSTLHSNGSVTLSRRTRVTGPSATFITDDSLVLTADSTLVAEITGPIHSPLSAAVEAEIQGNLEVEFAGHTPAIGDVWDLVEAPNLGGDFDNITTTGIESLGPGTAFRTRTVESGGMQTRQLTLVRFLTLTVDRNDGSVTIDNTSDGAISLDGYRITSATGSLSVTDWTSLEDQAVNDWQEANPSMHQLAELKETGSTVVGGMTSAGALGNIYMATAPELGVEPEDLVFEYNVPGENETFRGLIEYTGEKVHNNLVLTVDPNSGEAEFTNESPFFTATIDGYRILSDSDSLTPATWTSLEDQGTGDWQEANPSEDALTELNETGNTLLALNSGTKFDLGSIFDTISGSRDLIFEYLLAGETAPQRGVVVYDSVSPGLPGDYNNDDIVNLADYTMWRDNLGASIALPNESVTPGVVDAQDYSFWRSRFGASTGSSAASVSRNVVPEPSTYALALSLMVPVGLMLLQQRGTSLHAGEAAD